MSSGILIFIGLVFFAVFFLATAIVVPKFGDDARTRKLLRRRLAQIGADDREEAASLLRAKYLRELSPLARFIETLPGMDRLARAIEQSGRQAPAYTVVSASAVLAVIGAFIAWLPTHLVIASVGGAIALGSLPIVKVLRDRKQRFDKLEEQLPDALDVIKRALRAGHPFASALKLVAEDQDAPIAKEFELTFSDINYGTDVRRAMLALLARVPSVTVMAFVTAVLVQKETGGNLAEILDQIAKVVRARFKFYRRVRTLSAEGRLSAWVLVMIPFVLFGLLTVAAPDYLPVLLKTELGQKIVMTSAALMVVGVFWVRRLIRVEI